MTLGSGVGTSRRHFQRTVGSGVGTRLRLRTAAVLILVATTAAQAQRSAPPPSAARAADSPVPPLLAAAVREGEALPRLHSLLVSQRGTVLVERYFHGTRATRLANVKSVAKSVISALVGVAVARGVIPSVREPIGTYFGDLLRAPGDAPKRAITVEDLLTMRSGLETTSNRNYGAWVRSPNWVRFALAQPLLTPPGTAMDYSTGSTHLLSAILTRATRKTTLQFAQEAIGTPLGFSVAPWTRDPQGIYFGGNDMAMTPRQMLAFGELYLHEGRVGATQVLPAQWIRDSWVPRGRSLRGDRDDRRVRLRLVDTDAGGPAHVLRMGIRRPVHLRRAGAGAGGRHHVVHGHRRRAARAPAHGERAGGVAGYRAAGRGALELESLSTRGARLHPTPNAQTNESVIRRAAAARGSCSRTTP